MTRPQQQCKACPWRKGTDPHTIPNGYCEAKHRALSSTIAKPGALTLNGRLHLMACHESPVGKERACVGWLANQLGPGNNLALRLAVISKQVNANFELSGEQHDRLEDTFPEEGMR